MMNSPDSNVSDAKPKRNPVEDATIFSKLLFLWLKNLFWVGIKRPIEEEDIYDTLKSHKSARIVARFNELWTRQCATNPDNPSFLKVILQIYGCRIFGFGFLYTVFDIICKVIQPLCLGGLVTYFRPGQTEISETEAYYYAGGIIFCSLVPVLTFHPFILYIFQIGMKIRLGCCAMLYQKALKITKSVAVNGFDGQVINLMSNDVAKFDTCTSLVHDLWKGPVELFVLGYFIYKEIDVAGLVGIGFLLSIIPLQGWLGRKAAVYRSKTAKRTDKRVRFMNEIIQGIQVIKMYTWEKSFAKIVDAIRRQEIKTIRGTLFIRGTCISFNLISRMCIFLSLVTYLYMDEVFTARKVFMVTSYFNYLYGSMLHFWSLALTSIAEGIVSAKRVQTFLLYPETKEEMFERQQLVEEEVERAEAEKLLKTNGTVTKTAAVQTNGNLKAVGRRLANLNGCADFHKTANRRVVHEKALKAGVKLDGATAFWWNEDKQKNIGISGISVSIEPNVLCAIIGPVGAGKSTLLQTILGELQLDEGFIHVNGRVSYASQLPWLFEGSIRQNIVFVEEYNEIRYNRVIQVCALEKDFLMLQHGDETIVGERGISLSGGQRARVNLARAIYKKADIYLLDDPLSAVDAHVGKYIFENCIKNFLGDKVCILVTHQLQYLQEVKHALLMNQGRVEVQGTFKELKSSKSYTLLAGALEEAEQNQPEESPKKKPIAQSVTKESQIAGAVGFGTYKSYLKSVENNWTLIWVSVLFITAQVSMSGIDYFVSKWVNWEESMAEKRITINSTSQEDINIELTQEHQEIREGNIYIYSSTIGVLLVLTLTRSFSFFKMCLRASINLHDKLFKGIIRAKMFFYNNNPSGRILNRFSRDIGCIDVQLPIALMDCLTFFLEFIAVITLVAIVNYWLLFPTFVMSVLFYCLRHIYINTARSVKRLEALTRSPIFSHTNSTLQGLSTIRACNAQQILIGEFDRHQDLNTSAWYLYLATTRAFALWLELVCVMYIASVTCSFLLLGNDSLGGNVGLAITQVFNLIFMCQWGMRQTAELENQMTSVERIIEYVEQPPEPPMETEPKYRPDNQWPSRGQIQFSNFSLKYSETGKWILNDINLVIQPEEKVGIVGRTGAGKSSIIQALFRLAFNEGRIEIDGIDTETLGLHDLRSKVSIIPQDPILFSGTLRQNLDPFEEKADEEIWSALEQVELKGAVTKLPYGLVSKMSDGGSNFSMGQRQLICLARAILRNNRILILDEATANVDPETDKLIQTTIRNNFASCTVLTIAHRLHTVMDSDKVLVMDAGRVVEFGHPYQLIEKAGFFKALVDQTGQQTSETLIKIAKDNYLAKSSTTQDT